VRLRTQMPRFEVLPSGGTEALRAQVNDARLDLIVVDPLQWLARGAGNTEEELADAIRQLKLLALEQHVPIFTTSHLPHLAARDDRRPSLDDFGALGAVKQHADVVLALFREDMYDRRREIEGATELLVRKNRNGGTGYADLYFYAQWMRFEDMVDPDR
jgi:replicative DNA helicase